jgi:hypothetical protein
MNGLEYFVRELDSSCEFTLSGEQVVALILYASRNQRAQDTGFAWGDLLGLVDNAVPQIIGLDDPGHTPEDFARIEEAANA